MTRFSKCLAFGLCMGIGGWARDYAFRTKPAPMNMADAFILYLLGGLALTVVVFLIEPVYRVIKGKITGRKESANKTFIDF